MRLAAPKVLGEASWSGHFEFPVKGRFELTDGITYLGHVKMVNRQRKQGEERSGGVLPLIDRSGADSRAAPLTLPSLTGARPTFRSLSELTHG